MIARDALVLTDGVTLGEHAHSGNDVAPAVGGEGRERVLLEHLPDDLDLALALSGGLAVDPSLTLLEGQVSLYGQLSACRLELASLPLAGWDTRCEEGAHSKLSRKR